MKGENVMTKSKLFKLTAVAGAVAALGRGRFAEILQQKAPQALGRGGIKCHVLEPFFCLAGGFGLHIGGLLPVPCR